MKALLISALLTGIWLIPAFAADRDTNPPGSQPTVEQKRAEIMEKISQRIARSQEEMACVQSASSHAELKACREKYRPDPKPERQNRKL